MINIDNITTEIYITIIILTIVFFLFSKVNTNNLIIIIIVIILGYFAYFYLKEVSHDKDNNIAYVENTLDKDIKERHETNEKIFYLDKFPKTLKYLKQNKRLIDIVTNLQFTKKFNKTRYSDIILNANKMMKIYIYILSERYDPSIYLSLFIDIRDNIIELMHSLIMIIPEKMKHTYGVDTYSEIGRSITDFTEYSKEMMNILEKYALIHKKVIHIPDNKYKAYNIALQSFYP